MECYQGDKQATAVPKVAARATAARGWRIRTDFAACNDHRADAETALRDTYGADVVMQWVAPHVAAWEDKRRRPGRVIEEAQIGADLQEIRQKRMQRLNPIAPE